MLATIRERIIVYPNPNNGEFTFAFKSDSKIPVQVETLNLLGEVVLAERTEMELRIKYKASLIQMLSGIYLPKVRREEFPLLNLSLYTGNTKSLLVISEDLQTRSIN